MFILDDMNITLTRGDSAYLEVTFTGDIPGEGDLVVMSLKNSTRDPNPKWEKTGECDSEGKVVFTISPQDTARLPFGQYVWDLRIFYADGQVTTPFAPKAFRIAEAVTNDRKKP